MVWTCLMLATGFLAGLYVGRLLNPVYWICTLIMGMGMALFGWNVLAKAVFDWNLGRAEFELNAGDPSLMTIVGALSCSYLTYLLARQKTSVEEAHDLPRCTLAIVKQRFVRSATHQEVAEQILLAGAIPSQVASDPTVGHRTVNEVLKVIKDLTIFLPTHNPVP
jgi:hypothetical protein